MRITYSPRALRDLIEIADYLVERSPSGAARVEQQIRRIIQLVPASGRVLASLPTVRVVPVATYPYLVFYMPLDDELIVLHIRHSSREPLDPSAL